MDCDVGEHQRAHALQHGFDRGVERVPLLAPARRRPSSRRSSTMPCSHRVDVTVGEVAGRERRRDADQVRGEVVHRPRRARRHRARERIRCGVEEERRHTCACALVGLEQVVHLRDGTADARKPKVGGFGRVTR